MQYIVFTYCIVLYSIYQQRQQNTHYPKGGRFCESNNFLKLLIGSQPIIEGRSLIVVGGVNIA